MSAKSEQLEGELEAEDEVCASCGVAGVDDTKLKKCACLVKYCSNGCQENHREQHKKECKRRKAELHDKDLFTQPNSSHVGECPLCCLPLPLIMKNSTMMGCCSKIICNGCSYANQKRESEQGLQHRCAFCREPISKSDEESDKQIMERIKKHDDPVAMTHMGKKHDNEGEYGKALEYWTKAAESGNCEAHYNLGRLYQNGNGVVKDVKKAIYHFEQAAIGGHPDARGYLGAHEMDNGKFERAAKHHIIAANQGQDISLKLLKDLFVAGVISKDDYAAALRGYQAAMDATKSAGREKAEEAEKTTEPGVFVFE